MSAFVPELFVSVTLLWERFSAPPPMMQGHPCRHQVNSISQVFSIACGSVAAAPYVHTPTLLQTAVVQDGTWIGRSQSDGVRSRAISEIQRLSQHATRLLRLATQTTGAKARESNAWLGHDGVHPRHGRGDEARSSGDFSSYRVHSDRDPLTFRQVRMLYFP